MDQQTYNNQSWISSFRKGPDSPLFVLEARTRDGVARESKVSPRELSVLSVPLEPLSSLRLREGGGSRNLFLTLTRSAEQKRFVYN